MPSSRMAEVSSSPNDKKLASSARRMESEDRQGATCSRIRVKSVEGDVTPRVHVIRARVAELEAWNGPKNPQKPFCVNVKGVKVFVPRSQATFFQYPKAGMRRDEDYTALVGQHVQLVVTECSGRKIVGSINKVTAEQNKAKREEFWANVEVGKTYTGVVKSLTSYGAFVDIGGVDGLCHISELSWNRIKHPSEVVSVGDTIEVYVKDIDTENHKVSLGYKKSEDNPWEQLKNNYPIGSTFHAPVVSLTKFGAFVRILPGVDGLVHISEISNDRVEKVSDALKVGDMVDVKLLDVDFDKKRISLSMKALLNDDAE